jgi:L-ribulose-5-phosphate 3-epimerase
MNTPPSQRLAVCSWSLQPTDPHDLIAKLQTTGLRRVQLALDPLRENPQLWGKAPKLFADAGISILSAMFGCVGEDYSTLDTIRISGGIAPDATWKQNWANIQATAELAQTMGLKLVTFHAGFLPHDDTHPDFSKLRDRLVQVAGQFAQRQITLGLETGQETAPVLRHLMENLNHPQLGVNFDPANMILYDKGDPIEALRVLGPWIRQVHIKDARRTRVPGAWGEEVAVGDGEVNWAGFFSTLEQLQFSGDCVIEREAGTQRATDIRKARDLVEQVCARA